MLHDNPSMGPYGGSDPGVFETAVDNLRAKGREFTAAYNVLMSDYSRAAKNPATLEKWKTLKNYADKVRGTIEYIAGSVDSISGWFYNTFGLSAVDVARNSGMGQMGVVPMIPVAAVTAAVAAIVYIVGEIYKFHSLLNATPEQVQNVVTGSDATSTGVVSNVTGAVKWVAIAALVIYAAPRIMDMMKKGAR